MTDDNRYELSRRKALAGLGTIGAAGAAAGFGTSAMFYDEETYSNNSITAGEVDLTVNADVVGANGEYQDAVGYPNINVSASADGEAVVGELTFPDFKNGDWIIICWEIIVVDNPACLTITPTNPEFEENGVNDAEEDAGDDPASKKGELQNYLQYSFWGTRDAETNTEKALGSELVARDAVADISQVGPLPVDTPGDGRYTRTVYTLFELPMPGSDNDVTNNLGDNDAQGDTVEFDLEFRAEQSRNNECEFPDDGGDGFE